VLPVFDKDRLQLVQLELPVYNQKLVKRWKSFKEKKQIFGIF